MQRRWLAFAAPHAHWARTDGALKASHYRMVTGFDPV
jgi:hypothetical protein